VLLCVGVVLAPMALLLALYIPALGAVLGIASVGALLFGAFGVVGGFSRSN
jgi:hypothetical protein